MRKILGYKTTYIDREKTNAKIYRDINEKVKEQGSKKEIVTFREARFKFRKNKTTTNNGQPGRKRLWSHIPK